MVEMGRLLLECLFRQRVCVFALLCLCGRSFLECLFRQRRRVLTLFAFPFRVCLRAFRVAQELRGSNVVVKVVVVSLVGVVVRFRVFPRFVVVDIVVPLLLDLKIFGRIFKNVGNIVRGSCCR